VNGTLWEATATDEAIGWAAAERGTATAQPVEGS
jgi:hypothetical protein